MSFYSEPPPIVWGDTLCSRKGCVATAVLSVDRLPFCLDCGDDEVERALAFELNPAMTQKLPDLGRTR